MKLYYKDKLKIIEMYEKGISQTIIAMQYNVNKNTIKYITRLYREHGIEFLEDKKKDPKYTAKFKFELVKRVINGESKSSVGAEYGINPGTIYAWCKKYNDLGYNGLKQDLRGGPGVSKTKKTATPSKAITKDEKIEELEKENKRLKMEIDLLKKLNALVQQRKEQQDKKK